MTPAKEGLQTDSTSPTVLTLERTAALAGRLHGFAQPCLRATLLFTPPGARAVPPDLEQRIERAMADRLVLVAMEALRPTRSTVGASDGPDGPPDPAWPVIEALNHLLIRLQETAGMPVATGLHCEAIAPAGEAPAMLEIRLAIPSLAPSALGAILPWALETVAAAVRGERIDAARLGDVLGHLERNAPNGVNNRMLLQAAYQYRVPASQLPGQVFQYGWGARSRWLDSTISDRTSAISAGLARDKLLANTMMRRAGLPVPEQVAVRSADEAVAQAARIGYPVVIKPADLDGGKGVSADIADEATLRICFDRAWAHSRRLLLEKHIPGRDHRLGVQYDELAWAFSREPAGVHGDGRSTIEELVVIANRDPNRGTQRWSNMKPLVIDEEAEELLATQGLARGSRLEAGRFAPLRRKGTIAGGGTPTPVTDQVHPDNAALARRAARIFRLDFAGIDFITPDITKSWLEVGGAICEINARPAFSVLVPEAALKAIRGLCEGDGRIPVAVILTTRAAQELALALAAQLELHRLTLGSSTEAGLSVGAAMVRPAGRGSPFDDAQALLMNPQVQAVMIATDGTEWLRTGSPFDCIDLLWIDEGADEHAKAALAARCTGEARILDDASWRDPDARARELADALAASDARHRLPLTLEPG